MTVLVVTTGTAYNRYMLLELETNRDSQNAETIEGGTIILVLISERRIRPGWHVSGLIA